MVGVVGVFILLRAISLLCVAREGLWIVLSRTTRGSATLRTLAIGSGVPGGAFFYGHVILTFQLLGGSETSVTIETPIAR